MYIELSRIRSNQSTFAHDLPSLIMDVRSNEVFLNEFRREKFSKAAESDIILSRSKGGGSFT